MASFVRCVTWVVLTTFVVFLAVGCSKKRPAQGLIDAACDGNVAECERLVKSGVSVNATDDDGVTALSWAVFYCRTDVVRKLIELGADVNHANQAGFTPLMYTATTLRGHKLRGTQEQRNEIAGILIEHGADVNHAMGDGSAIGDGQTTLHFAAKSKNPGLVKMLLATGANRNARSNQGYTPLDVAKFPDFAPNTEVIKALEEPVPPSSKH